MSNTYKQKNGSILPKFVFQRIWTGAYSRLIANAVFLEEVDLKAALVVNVFYLYKGAVASSASTVTQIESIAI